MFLLALALALLIGLSLGLLGGGGSILTVPILRYVLDMEAHQAIALSLLVVGTTSAAAIIPHARRGRVDFRTGAIFGAAGMLGAFGSGRIAQYIPAGLLLTLFGGMMVATAVAMLRDSSPASSSMRRSGERLSVTKVLAEGLVVGAITGLVGAGGGFLVVPALVLLGGLPMDVAVGTSLVVIAMKSFAGFLGFLGHTPINFGLGVALSAAAVVGSVAGGMLVHRVSPTRLRAGFGWFVTAVALFTLVQEIPSLFDLHIPIAAALAFALFGVVTIAALRRVSRSRGVDNSPNATPDGSCA